MPDIIQRSFTGGELAPSLRARTDISKAQSGLALCENMIIRSQGGAYSRPATRYGEEIKTSATRGRLLPFQFNTEQAYALVFEHLTLRFIKNGAYLMNLSVPVEIVTPYTSAEISRIQITQNADTVTICHPNHDPMNLGRISEISWPLAAISYASIVPAPVQGVPITVGAGAGTNNKTYTYAITAVDIDGRESLISNVRSLTTPSLTTTAGIQLSWAAAAGAVYYRIYKDPSVATGTYGWIGETAAPNLTFDDYNIAPITSDAPPEDRQPFAAASDKPSVVTYYSQRQMFANTINEPQTMFGTQVADYNSLRKSNPTRPDDAITFTINAKEVNEIRHLVSLDALIAMTSAQEWKVTEGQDQVLEPSTVGVKVQSKNGCSWVPPVVINDSIIFVQEKGGRVRDLGYLFAADKFLGSDLSLMAEHLFEGFEIEEMAYSAEPYGIIWCVRSDGVLVAMTYQKEHKVWAWHHHITDGFFESVTVISEGNRDAVYFIVRRVINGVTKRYIERMEPREVSSPVNAFCVDSGLTYDGTNLGATTMTVTTATDYLPFSVLTITASVPSFAASNVGDIVVLTDAATGLLYEFTLGAFTSTTIMTGTVNVALPVSLQAVPITTWALAVDTLTGLGHLEGKPVAVLADGNEVLGMTVTAGEITMLRPAVVAHVGLAYLPVIETLDVDQPGAQSIKGDVVSVSRVTLELESSRGGWVGPKLTDDSIGEMLEIKPRFDSDGYDAIALKTSKVEIQIEPTWSKGGGIRIEQRSPLPLAILSAIPKVEVGG